METTIKPLAKRCTEIAYELFHQGKRMEVIRIAIMAMMINPDSDARKGLFDLLARAIFGSRFVEGLRGLFPGHETTGNELQGIREAIRKNPLNPDGHFDLGLYFLNEQSFITSYACLKTARSLARLQSLPEERIEQFLDKVGANLNIENIGNRQYQRLLNIGDPFHRMRFLSRHIDHNETKPKLVLDVGGGDGFLSILMKNYDYVLVEPEVNGLSGIDLPFEDGIFDIVISSHAYEHIESEYREKYLNQIIRASKEMVFILGPFRLSEEQVVTDKTIFENTGASWAKEHVDLGLPVLSVLCDYLSRLHHNFEVTPHADSRVMYWQYLASHFATRAGEDEAFLTLTSFFHEHFDYTPANPLEPHDFLVKITKA